MKPFSITAAAIAATSLTIFACSGGSDDDGTSSSSSSSGSTSSADGGGSSSSSSSSGSTSSSSGGGGSFSCDTKSKCPNEPAMTAQQKEQCQQIYDGECGDEYKALGACFIENEKCATDGTSDTKATNSGPCKTQSDAFTECFLKGIDAGQ